MYKGTSTKLINKKAIPVSSNDIFKLMTILDKHAIYKDKQNNLVVAIEMDSNELYTENTPLKHGLYMYKEVHKFTKGQWIFKRNTQVLVFKKVSN